MLCDSRWWWEDVVLTASAVWRWPFSTRLGEEDMVVAVVVAVGGRSSDNLDTAAPEVEGSVDGAVFDRVDSVPSAPFPVSIFDGIWKSKDRTNGDELYVLL
jgi:hypothetical protein